jgi:triosephosphate isomerase
MKINRNLLFVGNWKMNGTLSSLAEIENLKSKCSNEKCEIIICPPSTLLTEAVNLVSESIINIGSQNCHSEKMGAHTGEISAKMLSDLGVKYVILGHSERRKHNNETNNIISKKALAAHREGLIVILCVGETIDQKENGKTEAIITGQIQECLPNSANPNNLIIAYEPVWAIGSGEVPKLKEIEHVHKNIRNLIKNLFDHKTAEETKILYGGSVKATNAKEIVRLENVDGALVGGASLLCDDFYSIISSVKENI